MEEKQDKNLKGSVLEKEKEDKEIEAPDYSPVERDYISNLQKRLESAQKMRDQSHDEFDGMSYTEYYDANERTANTAIKLKKNRGDVSYQSGTLRTKMMAFLSYLLGLNLKPDITAFGGDDMPLGIIGNAMEDIIEKTQELENDEEKKILRQYELLVQGTVFLEEIWQRKMEKQKEIVKGFYGQMKGVLWKTKNVLGVGRPVRTIVSGKSVYLGDLKQYFIKDQPYIFTIEIKNRVEAEQIYGKWERWQYVSKEKKSFSDKTLGSMENNAWRFVDELDSDQVEIVKYQDKPNKEYQIIINGVPMLPMGFPFPWGHGEYSIVQQNLEPIKQNFAYGKSFVFKNKDMVALLDEMMKLAVLKTQKSFMPPYLNLSGRIVSKSVFMPGKISRGIEPGSLTPVSDKEVQGVTSSEFSMIQEVIKQVDSSTASQTFTGAREQGGKVTATQIVELQRQARVMMGLTVLVASLLEEKLTSKRLMILIQNWFSPLDTVMDEAREALKNRYRVVSMERNIEGEGRGVRMTAMAEELPSSEELRLAEDTLQKRFGKPFRLIVLKPEEVQSTRLTWKVRVNPKERESSETSKLMFRAEMQDAMDLGMPIKPDWAQSRFAETWGENPDKMFEKKAPANEGGMPAPAGMPTGGEAPKIKAPKMVAKQGEPAGITK